MLAKINQGREGVDSEMYQKRKERTKVLTDENNPSVFQQEKDTLLEKVCLRTKPEATKTHTHTFSVDVRVRENAYIEEENDLISFSKMLGQLLSLSYLKCDATGKIKQYSILIILSKSTVVIFRCSMNIIT